MGILESTRIALLVGAATLTGDATALSRAERSDGSTPPAAAASVTPSPTAAAQAAIKQARLRQNAAIASHDLDAIASYWTDDVTICRGLGLQLAGKAAYRKLFADDDPLSKDVIEIGRAHV